MTTKMNTSGTTKVESSEPNDWDQGDESWEDWGDAEDNFQDTITEPEAGKTNIVNTKERRNDENFNNNSSDSKNSEFKDANSNQHFEEKADNAELTKSSWGSKWMPWGGVVSSVLSTATEGLGNITSSVSQSLNQVIGVPDPEEMARINAAEATKCKELQENKSNESDEVEKSQKSSGGPVFGLNIVSGVTTLGSKVINTGLDTLEGIGKKTMDILQENDPLLMNKRKMLGLEPDRPNLSEILKEAKKDADQIENQLKELKLEKSRELLRFDVLFENNCGLVHLEALEILSKESALKLQALLDSVSGNALKDLQETIDEVKELLELEELDGESEGNYSVKELNEKLNLAVEDAGIPINFDDIVNIWSQAVEWISASESAANEQEVFCKGLTTLSETCALEMNKLHKIAELLLVKDHHSTANEVDSIVQLCKQFHLHLNGLTNRFATLLTSLKSEEAKAQTSALFAEMLVAAQQIEKAFKLFLPILQIGAA